MLNRQRIQISHESEWLIFIYSIRLITFSPRKIVTLSALGTFETISLNQNWLLEVNGTGMTKSYKMVVLKYMPSRGRNKWLDPITAEQAAPFFHQYLTAKSHSFRIDFSDRQGKNLRVYNVKKVSSLIARMPMAAWSGSSKGLISYDDGLFTVHVDGLVEHRGILYDWTRGICAYRLHEYFERKADGDY